MRNRPRHKRSPNLLEPLEPRALLSGATISGVVHNDINGDSRLDEFSTTPATVVYLDANKNGRRDSSELSTTTDDTGAFTFKNVPAGTWVVRVQVPPGFYASNPAASGGQLVRILSDASPVTLDNTFFIRHAAPAWSTTGQNFQHTGISPFRGGPLTNFQELTNPDTSTSSTTLPDTGYKFGTPLVTQFNTVLVPVWDQTNNIFSVRAFSRPFGVILWTFTSDWKPGPTGNPALFQPALDKDGLLYVPGAAGSVHVLNLLDFAVTDTTGKTVLNGKKTEKKVLVFYGRKQYKDNFKKFADSVFINTGLTLDDNGNVYFGYETRGGNPLGLKSGLARATLRGDGTGNRVETAVLSGSTPALSNDDRFLYVTTQNKVGAHNLPKLERFATGNLARAGAAVLKDIGANKRLNLTPGAEVEPTVAPDGDVYYQIPTSNPALKAQNNGWLLHFNADLSRQETPAVAKLFQTPGIVPGSMIKGFKGSYAVSVARFDAVGGSTLQHVVLLDPNHPAADRVAGRSVMSDLRTSIVPSGSLENAPVTVDPSNGYIYFLDTQSGLTRWHVSHPGDVNVTLSVFTATATQTSAPATNSASTVTIGPDGQIYITDNGSLWAAF